MVLDSSTASLDFRTSAFGSSNELSDYGSKWMTNRKTLPSPAALAATRAKTVKAAARTAAAAAAQTLKMAGKAAGQSGVDGDTVDSKEGQLHPEDEDEEEEEPEDVECENAMEAGGGNELEDGDGDGGGAVSGGGYSTSYAGKGSGPKNMRQRINHKMVQTENIMSSFVVICLGFFFFFLSYFFSCRPS